MTLSCDLTHFQLVSLMNPSYYGLRYIPLGRGPKTGLMRWSKKGGTGKNENFHSSINRLVQGVARIGVQACEARLLQRIHRHNYDMDRKLGNTSKQSTPWVWREREVNARAEVLLTSIPFPKARTIPEVSPSCTSTLTPTFRLCPFVVGDLWCEFPRLCLARKRRCQFHKFPAPVCSDTIFRYRERSLSRWGSSTPPRGKLPLGEKPGIPQLIS